MNNIDYDNLLTKVLRYVVDLIGDNKNVVTDEYFITHTLVLMHKLKTPAEKIVALLNEICLTELLSDNININGLEKLINELPIEIMEASKILSYDSAPSDNKYINKVKLNNIAKNVLIADLKLKMSDCYNDKTCSKGNHLIDYQKALDKLI